MAYRARRLLAPVLLLGALAALAPAVASAGFPGRNGKLALERDEDRFSALYVADLDGRWERMASRFEGLDPAWSASGRAVAWVASGRGGSLTIRISSNDGIDQRQLTDPGPQVFDLSPTWSPGGRRLAFDRHHGGSAPASGERDIWTVARTGGEERRLTFDDADDVNPAWSPDGRRIAFVSDRFGNDDIFTMFTDGSDQVALTDDLAAETSPVWSPGGSRIAFVRSSPARTDLLTMRRDGTHVRFVRRLRYQTDIAWSPDGRWILYWQHGLRRVRPDGTGAERVPVDGYDADLQPLRPGTCRYLWRAHWRGTHDPYSGLPRQLVTGTVGGDRIVGSSDRDRLEGFGGADCLAGRGHDDILLAGPGDDVADGGAGADRVHGGSGDDVVKGGPTGDRLYGESGNDRLYADDDDFDRVFCGSGRDAARVDPGDAVSGCERVRRVR